MNLPVRTGEIKKDKELCEILVYVVISLFLD